MSYENGLLVAYSATFISISGRFVFMYLLYTKKSTNLYSLLFSVMNMVSSTLWITYSQIISDMPLLIRGSSDLLLFTISTIYILHNRLKITSEPYEKTMSEP
jgi:lipid-A-disaccharide synthase-like uncharacterized protein